MDLRYTSEKITDRNYRVTHLKTGKIFDIWRLSPTNSQWVAYEVKDGKKEKKQFASSDKSRKDLLTIIHDKMFAQPKKRGLRPGWRYPVRKPRFKRIKPWQFVELNKEYLSTTGTIRIRYTSPVTKEKFMLISTSEGWRCTIIGIAQQPICIGMASIVEAELELQFYLSPDPQTLEEWAEYTRTCFVEVK